MEKTILTNAETVENVESVENATAPTEQTEPEREKPYKFRRLSAEDVFPMFTIISKIGIKEFKTFYEGEGLKNIKLAFREQMENNNEDADAEDTVRSAGISIFVELLGIMMANLPKAEKDIFLLLSRTSNLDEKAVRKLDMADFAEMIMDFFKKEEFGDFFKVVSKLFK